MKVYYLKISDAIFQPFILGDVYNNGKLYTYFLLFIYKLFRPEWTKNKQLVPLCRGDRKRWLYIMGAGDLYETQWEWKRPCNELFDDEKNLDEMGQRIVA